MTVKLDSQDLREVRQAFSQYDEIMDRRPEEISVNKWHASHASQQWKKVGDLGDNLVAHSQDVKEITTDIHKVYDSFRGKPEYGWLMADAGCNQQPEPIFARSDWLPIVSWVMLSRLGMTKLRSEIVFSLDLRGRRFEWFFDRHDHYRSDSFDEARSGFAEMIMQIPDIRRKAFYALKPEEQVRWFIGGLEELRNHFSQQTFYEATARLDQSLFLTLTTLGRQAVVDYAKNKFRK